ncbi:MAG: LUD domain-containing protein, partial [Cyclobacteriaceae bacterium]|nr:LUD domain-containing protein [Cyclobacteriaceae bacterium]
MKGHPEKAKEFLKNKEKVAWHDKTIWLARTNRDSAASRVPEWEELRDLASNIKEHLLSRLDEYLEEFENNAAANGVKVHWAKDGKAHNEIVRRIIEEKKARRIVKSKSILTEECGMNHELEALGFEVVDTDLGERIIQFARQRPSHIVAPAIHLSSEEISEIFHEALNTEKGNEDPQYLTETARQHLREKFFSADIAMTGVNFAVAETGAFVVCTNEGNADMGVHLADVHIASMSIEKLVPKTEHLGVMLRLLARSATGQFITTYTSHFRRPKPGQEMHIVIVDNGRSDHLGLTDFRAALKCIR